jgi:hypothetical protein
MADELQWEREEPHVCRHTKSKVFRSTDDPNDVLLLQDVTDVSKARTWYGSSEMKSLMEKSGVVGSPSTRSAA